VLFISLRNKTEVITKHDILRINICASRKDGNGENCTPRSSSPSIGKITGLKRMKCTAENINTDPLKTFFATLTQVLLLEVHSDIPKTNQKKKIQFIYIHLFIHSQSPLSHSKPHTTIRKCQQFRIFKLLVRISV